jgi:hypothetical protein
LGHPTTVQVRVKDVSWGGIRSIPGLRCISLNQVVCVDLMRVSHLGESRLLRYFLPTLIISVHLYLNCFLYHSPTLLYNVYMGIYILCHDAYCVVYVMHERGLVEKITVGGITMFPPLDWSITRLGSGSSS